MAGLQMIEGMRKENNIAADDMGFGGMKIIQDPSAFKYGVDAVLLADFAACGGKACDRNSGQDPTSRTKSGKHRMAELGAGNGAVSLIYSHKTGCDHILAIEVQEEMAALCLKNAEINGLQEQIEVLHRDIMDLPAALAGTFDVVVTNPPYFEKGCGLTGKRNVARHETTAALDDFVRISSMLLENGGVLYMIHRAFRLADVISSARKQGMEPKVLQLVAPSPGKEPDLMLIKCVKGGGRELKLRPTLYVRDKNGNYTAEIERIYERI